MAHMPMQYQYYTTTVAIYDAYCANSSWSLDNCSRESQAHSTITANKQDGSVTTTIITMYNFSFGRQQTNQAPVRIFFFFSVLPWCKSPPVVITDPHSILSLLFLLELQHLLLPRLIDVEHEKWARVALGNLKLIK